MLQKSFSLTPTLGFLETKLAAKRAYQDYTGLVGIINVCKFDQWGKLVQEEWTHNLVTDIGDAYYAEVISGSRTRSGTFVAIGTGTLGPAKANTTLQFEISRGAVDSTYPLVSGGANDNDCVWRRTFTGITATGVVECGILTAAASGTLVDRGTFTSVNLTSADSLQVTITITHLGV